MRILDFSNPAAAELQTSGGKGSSLAKLTLGGFAVPRGFIITSSAYREFLAQSTQTPHFDVDNLALLEEQSKAYRAHLMSLELGNELLLELEKALGGFDDTQSFSVRSSSTLEDLSAGAFAGAHDTFLHCYKDEIATKIKACFASLWHTRAIAYRAKMGFAHDEAFMAVVVQEMIQADKSGVGFSINPIDCNFSQVLLNANYGLGESVVGGEFDVDEYRVSKDDFSLTHSFIANKTHAIFARDTQSPYIEPHWRLESGSAKNPLQSPESQALDTSVTPHADGTQRFGIKPSFATAPALTPEEIAEVAQLNAKLQAFYGFPQDIEWAFKGKSLYVLQSRPITSIPPRWTRDESAERYPKALTPFTWDYVERAFHISLEHSFRLLSLPPMQGKWFAMFDNYIYGNQNAVALYMGQSQALPASLHELLPLLPKLQAKLKSLSALPRLWYRDLDTYLLKLGALHGRDLRDLSLGEVWDFVEAIVQVGEEYFKPNIAISISQAMLYKTLLALLGLLEKSAHGTPLAFSASELFVCFTTTDETKTSLVNAQLYTLAQLMRQNTALLELYEDKGSERIMRDNDLLNFAPFHRAFGEFLEAHGHREVEFDAYVPTWGEAPHIVLDTIALIAKSPDTHKSESTLKAQKYHAKKKLCALISSLDSENVGLEAFMSEFLELVETYTILDDVEHYETTRLTPLVRKAVRALGERLKTRGIVEDEFDVFFAHIESLEGCHAAGWGDRELLCLKEQILANKQTYQRNAAKTPAWVLNEESESPSDVSVQNLGGDLERVLRGIPASAGVAEGEVCLVRGSEDFASFKPQSILVAQTTNPAWTPLFYSAKAIITQSGGALSHGAVTAREMKIPAVMAVPRVMERLKNGDRVRIDGTSGIITLL